MAKRFTDTDKWKKEWFYKLNTKAKLAWYYLLDQCDHRGVWFRNFRLMSDQIGFKVTEGDIKLWFGDKIRPFDDDKYFIPSFVDFQYGELNSGNKAHRSVLQLLEDLELGLPAKPLASPLLAPTKDLASPCQGAQDKDKDKDKDKDIYTRGGNKPKTSSIDWPLVKSELKSQILELHGYSDAFFEQSWAELLAYDADRPYKRRRLAALNWFNNAITRRKWEAEGAGGGRTFGGPEIIPGVSYDKFLTVLDIVQKNPEAARERPDPPPTPPNGTPPLEVAS